VILADVEVEVERRNCALLGGGIAADVKEIASAGADVADALRRLE
jgi:hypothetical protein